MGGKSSKKEDITKPEKEKDTKEEKDEKDKEKPTIPPVPYFRLFRYASGMDKLLLLVGCLAALGSGFSMPLMVIYFGRITDSMVGNAEASADDQWLYCKNHWAPTTAPPGGTTTGLPITSSDAPTELNEAFLDDIKTLALGMIYIGIGTLILGFVFVASFNIVAENQVYRIRRLYLEALLRQNVGWYDTVQDKNFVSRIAEDLIKIQEATGEKVGLCIFFMATCFLSLGNAFWHGWKLTLVVLSSAPVLAISASVVAGLQSKVAASEQESYAKAGTVAQEAITNIKTVMAFSGADKEVQRYEEGLEVSKIAGKKRGAVSSFGMGLMWLIIYAAYALAFWYGTKLILQGREKTCADPPEEPEYTAENMIIVFFSVLMGAFNIGQSASYFESFAVGKGAGATIFSIIDRVPEIDSYSEKGKKPTGRAKGQIEFRGVDFYYPSRPDVQILKGFNLTVKPGQTVALVGHSGCGKSTCIQLLQRFYDPLSGSIFTSGTGLGKHYPDFEHWVAWLSLSPKFGVPRPVGLRALAELPSSWCPGGVPRVWAPWLRAPCCVCFLSCARVSTAPAQLLLRYEALVRKIEHAIFTPPRRRPGGNLSPRHSNQSLIVQGRHLDNAKDKKGNRLAAFACSYSLMSNQSVNADVPPFASNNWTICREKDPTTDCIIKHEKDLYTALVLAQMPPTPRPAWRPCACVKDLRGQTNQLSEEAKKMNS
ncbi:Multidrug resistance protein 1 [Orchesella cincta]|uniref:Multidrug resistance protein 1 n=1 Tax=Orchesella cincta TaxID=48709 RepID=A0A1D2MLX0_ORCCI|nr:Multidrug resistance protein 1 [Orchesella cincta]